MIILESSEGEKRVKQLFREIGIERKIIEHVGKNENELKAAFENFCKNIEKSYPEKEVVEIKKYWNYKTYYSVVIELLIRQNTDIFINAISDGMNPTIACFAIFAAVKTIVENNNVQALREDLEDINEKLKEYNIIL